ncbi:nicotinic acid mononucleotide adenyltransferase [Winogradskyella maritima]|uniref:Nicotinic acid mononucleotide adenyltransferase n=1 Tax=Winogradskyella maritima TaxID=1517766 RepID=A0ABV8AI89_9FLAO|nr:nicotinic acid mononucleotide adenyltransferase [Winogradskyella maritima]
MKTLKLLMGFALTATLFTSCYVEDAVIVVDDPVPGINVNQLLNSYELWYVDVNETLGSGEVPFLQIAFTVSFRNGILYANNNLVGIGEQGNGFGIPIGVYDAYDGILDVNHDLDGFGTFDVFRIDNNTIELYNPSSDTSYFLNGYQRSNFDYDFVFYDNIHYFLQEYEAWEKTYTSEFGALDEFDNENYLQFVAGGNDIEFRSSQDANISNPSNIVWDFTGLYDVADVTGNFYLKYLTLDYDFFDNEVFELSVIDDGTIEILHADSGTVYEFAGKGYIEFLRQAPVAKGGESIKKSVVKKRKQKTAKKDNPRESTRS